MYRVLFVCSGNICRSPLAEELLRRKLADRGAGDRFEIDSAGTVADHLGQQSDPRMRRTAASHGVTIDHRARRVRSGEIGEWDLIVGMDDWHIDTLLAMRDGSAAEIRKMREYDPAVGDAPTREPRPRSAPDVPDPWYGGQAGFDEVYAMVDRSCEVLADTLARS